MADGISPRRPKRQSSSKMKKMELLAKMRDSVKGGKKMKYEIGELDSVYEEVDEKEYSRKVLERQEDDWIVDDDGCGYVEDGREIFDDDLDEVSVEKSKKETVGKKRSRSAVEPLSEGKRGNIRNMLVSMPIKKKKESNIKLEEDGLLGDLLGELDGIKTTPKSTHKNPFVVKSVEKEVSARDYMQSLTFKRKKLEKKVLVDEFNNLSSESVQVDKYCSSSRKDVLSSSTSSVVKTELLSPEMKEYKHEVQPTVKEESSPVSCTPPKEIKTEIEPNIHVEMKPELMDCGNASGTDLFEDFDTNDLGNLIEQASRENTPGKGMLEDTPVAPVDKVITGHHTSAKSLKFLNDNDSPKPQICESMKEEWESGSAFETPLVNVQIDRSSLPLTKNKNGEDVFRFYYWDAHEEIFSQPGSVFLFGKTYIESAKTYVSCCVVVKNIDRRIFLLPRENVFNLQTGVESSVPVTMNDVYNEFNTKIAPKFNLKEFKVRTVTKKYAFGKEDVPLESEYLEVRYSANQKALPSELTGETFSCVFGTKTSFLELLILDRSLKGPGWIDIKNAEPNAVSISWCKVEVNCNNARNVIRLGLDEKKGVPPVVLLTMVPYCVYNNKTKQSEVVAVACLINESYPVDKPPPQKLFNHHFCVMSNPSDVPWPYDLKEFMQKFKKTQLEKMESKRALLNYLITKIWKIDPDIIVGHDLAGFGIDIIVEQLRVHKVPNWSRFGRLKRSSIPSGKAKYQIERIALTGRLLCDIKLSAKEFIKSRSYDLDALCQTVLNFPANKRPEMNEDLFKFSYSSGETLLNTLWTLMSDASYILRIFAELNVLPLSLQISNIAGNVMSRTLMGGRAERNEYLLLHAFHNKDYIAPDKEYKKNKKDVGDGNEEIVKPGTRKKPAYSGGLVLDPKVGLYDDLILLMDFNSLYPSIIQEYNICFTTINISSINMEDDDSLANIDKMLPDDTVPPGVLPTEIRKLVESRREVKNILKRSTNLTPEMRMQYDIRQMALKLTANSMYGCLGFSHSRFYAKPLAAIVTEKGREILMTTKRLVESYGHEVIYGDTDSLMINTRTKEYDQVFQVGKKIKTEVNKNYKQVELDIDGVFKHMLLLKKKKYAAVTVSKLPDGEFIEKKEMKGLDMVRRDWSQLSAEIGKSVLDEILKEQSPDDRLEAIHSYLETIREELVQGRVPLSLLTVTKQLNRAPEQYPDAKALPHVQVAIRLNQASARRFKQGDTVPYVICEDGTSNPATQRAYHIEELKNPEKSLKIDTHYYLSQQIHPVIARLCDPIDGTDAASIARSLGLDPSAYRQKIVTMAEDETENPDLLFGKKDSERYKHCERFSFICNNESCKTENIIESATRKLDNGNYVLCLERCVKADCKTSPLSQIFKIQDSLVKKMYSHIEMFYENNLCCTDSTCGGRKRGLYFQRLDGAYPLCFKCHDSYMRREITPLQLYNQLSFYSSVFDLSKVAASKKSRILEHTQAAYEQLHASVNEILEYCAISKVNLGSLFSITFP